MLCLVCSVGLWCFFEHGFGMFAQAACWVGAVGHRVCCWAVVLHHGGVLRYIVEVFGCSVKCHVDLLCLSHLVVWWAKVLGGAVVFWVCGIGLCVAMFSQVPCWGVVLDHLVAGWAMVVCWSVVLGCFVYWAVILGRLVAFLAVVLGPVVVCRSVVLGYGGALIFIQVAFWGVVLDL